VSDTTGTDPSATDPTTGAATAETPAERYLGEVGRHLTGLSDDERDELLDDLAAHLHEVAADDPRPLHETLGPPDRFAAELLASAGLEGRTSAGAAAPTRFARLRARGRRLHDHRWTQATLDFLPELRPAWWVLRGYLVVLGLAAMFADGQADLDFFPVPSLGSPVVGLAVVVGAIVLSVRLGRSAGASRRGVRLADGAAVVLGLVALVHLHAGLDGGLTVEDPAYAVGDPELEGVPVYEYIPGGGLVSPVDGQPVTNIYAYDRDGRLIPEVLLYDQNGHPLDLGEGLYDPTTGLELTTDYPVDGNGAQVRNAYPLDQRTVEWDERGGPREQGVPPPAVVVPPPPSTTTTAPAP
jgi:hypothetical protein